MSSRDLRSIGATLLAERDTILARLAPGRPAEDPAGVPADLARRRQAGRDEANFNLSHLAQAIALERPALYQDFAGWLKVVHRQRRRREQEIVDQFQNLQAGLRDALPPAAAEVACQYVEDAVCGLPGMPDDLPGPVAGESACARLAGRYLESLLRGDRRTASRLVLDAVVHGLAVQDIYLGVVQVCQHEIGRLWQTNRISVAQEHFCTAASQLIVSQLYPHTFASEKCGLTLVATVVAGDPHELGVRMVADFFEMDGWQTYYLGADCPHADVIAALVERRADVLAVSATLLFHLEKVAELIRLVRTHPEVAAVRILVGGRPFNRDPTLWRKVGADGWAPDAAQAVVAARRLTGKLEL